MFCDKCGKQAKDTDVFCTGCGHKITKVEAIASMNENQSSNAAPSYQSSASQNLEQNAADINSNNQPSQSAGIPADDVSAMPQEPAMYRRKSNKGLIVTISICAALLLILAVIFVFIVINKDTDSKKDSDSKKPVNSAVVKNDGEDEEEKPDDEEDKEEEREIVEIDKDKIEGFVADNLDYTDFGVYVYNFDTEYEFGYNEDAVFPASAMCQVVILDTLSQAAKEKGLDMEAESVYFDYMANGKEAPDSKDEDGTYVSLKDCIEDVAVYGDNNKSNHIIDYIGYLYGESGFDVIESTLRRKGYSNTEINRKVFVNSAYIDTSASPNVTTAKEISKIFDNLINNCHYGTSTYMKNIFKSISNDGTAIGLKKYVPNRYDICSVNALNSQSTNDVAIISDGETEILVAILACTDEANTSVEDNDARELVQSKIIEHIIETQFQSGGSGDEQ